MEKVESMVDSPPDVVDSLAWPTDVIRSPIDGAFLGYRVSIPGLGSFDDARAYAADSTREHQSVGLFRSLIREILGIEHNRGDDAYRVARRLAMIVEALHDQGYALRSLSHDTVLVNDDRVVLTGCATYHVNTDIEMGSAEPLDTRYAPPEGWGTSASAAQLSDRFSLAVLLFRLLMEGHHPFVADGSAAFDGDPEGTIQNAPFPYRNPLPDLLEPPSDAPDYSRLHPELQQNFERCFVEGKSAPELRPSASEWVDALESAKSSRLRW